MFCQKCGAENEEGTKFCAGCGTLLEAENAEVVQGTVINNNTTTPAGEPKEKIVAGLLGILLGTFGVHNFYLGNTKTAIIQLVLGIAGFITCGITSFASAIWGLIEGIQILTGKITTDANGVPLKG